MLSTNLIRIIEYFFRNIPNRFNVNQIARDLRISVGSAYKIVKSLDKRKILISQRIGNGIYYTLNLDNKETENIVELVLIENKNKSLAENPLASVYAKDLQETEKFSRAVILFGSVLDKKKVNDIDALFLIDKGKGKIVEDFCLKLSSLRPKRINPLLMTTSDFKSNIKKQDKVVVNILKKGIIIFGEEKVVKILRAI